MTDYGNRDVQTPVKVGIGAHLGGPRNKNQVPDKVVINAKKMIYGGNQPDSPESKQMSPRMVKNQGIRATVRNASIMLLKEAKPGREASSQTPYELCMIYACDMFQKEL